MRGMGLRVDVREASGEDAERILYSDTPQSKARHDSVHGDTHRYENVDQDRATGEARGLRGRDGAPLDLPHVVKLDTPGATVGRHTLEVILADRRDAQLHTAAIARHDANARALFNLLRQLPSWQIPDRPIRRASREPDCAEHAGASDCPAAGVQPGFNSAMQSNVGAAL